MSKIQWTDTTWNPIFGCSKISEGCRNCYAETMAKRLAAMGQAKYAHVTTNGHWNGNISFSDHVINQPLDWRKPRRVFVNSMSDLFHENFDMQNGYLHKIFEVMLYCRQHTFQVLTKRPHRMRQFLSEHEPWLRALDEKRASHIWLGTSVENQAAAYKRVPELLQTPAAVRFLSCEPLLGDVSIKCPYDNNNDGDCHRHPNGCPSIDWVITGGESGHNARPMNINWLYSLMNQCNAEGTPLFIKQMGTCLAKEMGLKARKGDDMSEWPTEFQVREFPEVD